MGVRSIDRIERRWLSTGRAASFCSAPVLTAFMVFVASVRNFSRSREKVETVEMDGCQQLQEIEKHPHTPESIPW